MDWSSLIVPALTTLAGFVWSKLRGENTASIADTVRGVGKQLVHELVALGTDNREALNMRAQAFMGVMLGKLGLKLNGITEAIVNATIEHAIGDALEEFRDRTAELALANLTKPDAFAAAEAEGRARVADMKHMVEAEVIR